MGAVKSGRDAEGQAWQESWKEIYQHDADGIPHIHREASKWSNTEEGQCWSEGWTEDYRADGSVDRFCEKTGSLADGRSRGPLGVPLTTRRTPRFITHNPLLSPP